MKELRSRLQSITLTKSSIHDPLPDTSMPLTELLNMSLLTVQTVREEDEVMMRDCSGKEEKKKGNSSFLPLPPLRYLTTKE